MIIDPSVSVLMSVHNGASFLGEALESILKQTFAAFEFVCIDDGSTDGSGALLDEFARKDPRIIVIHQENMGLTRSLNRGLALARGGFVARMDADDISEPTRIRAQFDYLASHPEIGVLGTCETVINNKGIPLRRHTRLTDPAIVRWEMSHSCSVAHSSVMFRRDIVNAAGGYDPNFQYSQDYELWTRLLMKGVGIASLPQYLLRYRITGGNVFLTRQDKQDTCALEAGHRYVQWLLRHEVPLQQVRQMRLILSKRRLLSRPSLQAGMALSDELRVNAEMKCRSRNSSEIRKLLSDLIIAFARVNARPWPADSLKALRKGIKLLPQRVFDTRALATVLICILLLAKRRLGVHEPVRSTT
jgi:hypothetical protein